jgi:hypothetical protein
MSSKGVFYGPGQYSYVDSYQKCPWCALVAGVADDGYANVAGINWDHLDCTDDCSKSNIFQ